MKKIQLIVFIFIIYTINLNASYSIYYNGIEVGEIYTLKTIEQGYLKATLKNDLLKWILGGDYAVFHNKDILKEKDVYYKKDKKNLITIINKVLNEPLNEEETIALHNDKNEPTGSLSLKCDLNSLKCHYSYYNIENILKNNGELLLNKNKTLHYFKEETNNIELKEN